MLPVDFSPNLAEIQVSSEQKNPAPPPPQKKGGALAKRSPPPIPLPAHARRQTRGAVLLRLLQMHQLVTGCSSLVQVRDRPKERPERYCTSLKLETGAEVFTLPKVLAKVVALTTDYGTESHLADSAGGGCLNYLPPWHEKHLRRDTDDGERVDVTGPHVFERALESSGA